MAYKLGNSDENRFTPDGNNPVWFAMLDGRIGCIEALHC